MEGCALMFPLLDKAAKRRRPKDNNKLRMSKFIVDELEHVIALGTGLDLQFNPNGQKIVLGAENVGEVFYRLRCCVLHEVELPENVNFTRTPGSFEFAWKPATSVGPSTITVPAQFCELLHVALLGCPEYTSVSPAFLGRRVRFGRSEILPSQCVGKFGVLRHQLLFGTATGG
jgi:hypothetical protein